MGLLQHSVDHEQCSSTMHKQFVYHLYDYGAHTLAAPADGDVGSFSLTAAAKQLVLQAPSLSAAAVPSDAVVVKELPRSAAGKLMRGGLPHPDSLKPQTKDDHPPDAHTGTPQ